MADAAYSENNPPPPDAEYQVEQKSGPPHHVAPVTPAGSEATTIEQSRAIAAVQGAIVIAQQRPRVTSSAVLRMRESCQQAGLADRAFFRFSRAGTQVSGASVHLARELARCWGNVDYGVKELNRDDQRGVSEMLAFCWDLETNTRNETTYLVRHARDTKAGVKALSALRDIQDNNANMAARRLRECIFATLPAWFVEEAKEICTATIASKDNKIPMDQRRANALQLFEQFAVTQKHLEEKLGRSIDRWQDTDLATLRVIAQSMRRGETTVEEEFPDAGQKAVSAKDLADQAKGNGGQQTPPPKEEPTPDPTPEPEAAAEDDDSDFDIDVWKNTILAQIETKRGDRAALQQLRQMYGQTMAGLNARYPGQVANVDAAFTKAIDAAPGPAKGQAPNQGPGQGDMLGES